MVGNFIADTIKGEISPETPYGIELGIRIHRHIDTFTDSHSDVLEVRKMLYPYFSKYAAVVQDVYFDHFIAAHWSHYSELELDQFALEVYRTLGEYKNVLNPRAQRTLHYMEKQDWLYNYRSIEGIDRALKGLSSRASFVSNMENAVPPLLEHFNDMKVLFDRFWPELDKSVRDSFSDELKRCIETN
jgi:acyl carrier protein phosphodiesterase